MAGTVVRTAVSIRPKFTPNPRPAGVVRSGRTGRSPAERTRTRERSTKTGEPSETTTSEAPSKAAKSPRRMSSRSPPVSARPCKPATSAHGSSLPTISRYTETLARPSVGLSTEIRSSTVLLACTSARLHRFATMRPPRVVATPLRNFELAWSRRATTIGRFSGLTATIAYSVFFGSRVSSFGSKITCVLAATSISKGSGSRPATTAVSSTVVSWSPGL